VFSTSINNSSIQTQVFGDGIRLALFIALPFKTKPAANVWIVS